MEKLMNNLYAKAILYSYTNLEKLCDAIDEQVEQRALSSIDDFSSALEQYNKILSCTAQKDLIIDLKIVVELILQKFSVEDRELIEYKYFKKKLPQNVDRTAFKTRAYYRKQIRLLERFAQKLPLYGIDEQYFERKYLQIDFFKQLLRKVEEIEVQCSKNACASKNKAIKNVA